MSIMFPPVRIIHLFTVFRESFGTSYELPTARKVNSHTTAGLLDACEDVVLRRTRLSDRWWHRKKGTSESGTVCAG